MTRGYVALGLLVLATVLAWASSRPTSDISMAAELTQLFGGLALVGFACEMIISSRIKIIDWLFDGLDKAYVAHKQIGIVSVGLVVVHLVSRQPDRSAVGHDRAVDIGVPSLVLFVALTLLAIAAGKLGYEAWKTVHKLMVIPYVIGLVHYFGSSSYSPFGLTPFSIWMDVTAALGIVCAIYSVFLYEWIGFPYRYRITDLRLVAGQTVEITGRATARPLPCRPGQFAFIKFPGHRFGSHPFTISRADAATIQFTIKALGDHTTSLAADAVVGPGSGPARGVQVGDTLRVGRAHGRFDYTRGGRRQIWIAAGIGITPFRSFLHAGVPASYSVDLFYCFAGQTQAAYLDELESLTSPNLRLHPIDTSLQGRLSADQIRAAIDPSDPPDIFFCGPAPMRQALKKHLRTPAVRAFQAEEFQFRPARRQR